MTEYTLEEMVTFKTALAYEFDPAQVGSGSTDVKSAIDKTKKIFSNNRDFMKSYKEHVPDAKIEEDMEDMMPLAMMYAYYFGLDFIYRKKSNRQSLDMIYIRNSISPQKQKEYLTSDKNKPPTKEMVEKQLTDMGTEFYDKKRKHLEPFMKAIQSKKDPRHINPYYEQPGKDYFYQIPLYFRKIFVDSQSSDSLNELKVIDFLPAVNLAAISLSDLLPMSSRTKSGTLNFNQIEKIDNTLKERISISSDVEGCKYSDLLYKFVAEDLFFINRLNNVLSSYFDFCIQFRGIQHTKKREIEILRGIFAPYLFLPSYGIQEKYKSIVNEAAASLSERQDNARWAFHVYLPALFNGCILFPQLLSILLNYLFLDENEKMLKDNQIQERIEQIEEYIGTHQEEIKKHIGCDMVRVWDTETSTKYVIKRDKNKGRDAKNPGETRYWTEKRINKNITKLDIERITGYLIEPKALWKSASIVEKISA